MQFKVATLRGPEAEVREKINQKYPRAEEKSRVWCLAGVKVVETVITDHSNIVPWVPRLGGARIQLIIHMLQVRSRVIQFCHRCRMYIDIHTN